MPSLKDISFDLNRSLFSGMHYKTIWAEIVIKTANTEHISNAAAEDKANI